MASSDLPEAGFGGIQICVDIAAQPVLREVDFHLAPGEIQALVGKQNEGKSTLCRVLTGHVAPKSGWILVAGKPYRALTPILARDLGIEMVGAEAQVFPALSVAENLYTGSGKWWRTLLPWTDGFGDVRRWLQSNDITLPYRRPLSSLRREDWLFVELLNRLHRRPRLLIMDQTLEQLSPRRSREALALIRAGLADGMSVLWVTHNLEEAMELADRVTVLRQGRSLVSDHTRDLDRVTLLRLCYSELGAQGEEDITREQFYEFMSFIEAMLRDLPAAVIISDNRQIVRFVNQSGRELFPDRALAKATTLAEFFGDRNRLLGGHAVDSLEAASPDMIWHSLPVETADGKKRLVDMRTRIIQDRHVRIGCMILIEDVTSREEMRQSLALSENLASIGLLAAGVAHEVNDPLAIISNYLGFIRHEASEESVVTSANLAHEETVRIQQIIDNLVAFSGNRAPRTRSVDLMALAAELCRLLRFHTSDRTIRFTCFGPEEGAWVRADPNEMRQVFLNLFRNSLDAIEGDGEIRVDGTLEMDGDDDGDRMVRIAVSDTGHGIRLDNPKDIFKPFVTTKRGGGAHQGLGLSIVFGIVEKYGGTIQAGNKADGGSEFVLRFPYERYTPEE
ncbi:MAG: ATP-binding protein [Planctomycetaceae bacterium]|nr:ATP-binding protein [Planctomycetaceae bacterium]